MSGVTNERVPLRLITCGNANSGKSILIDRMLTDSKLQFGNRIDETTQSLTSDRTIGGGCYFAPFAGDPTVVGRQAGSEGTGSTFFMTPSRSCVVTETPDHRLYVNSLLTGEPLADVAIVLVDVQRGVTIETKRNVQILRLLGIRQVILAVNKMDSIEFAISVFDEVSSELMRLTRAMQIADTTIIPISALGGDNVFSRSSDMAWYEGVTLIEVLEAASVGPQADGCGFRLTLQLEHGDNPIYSGFGGRVSAGRIESGAEIVVEPGGVRSQIMEVYESDRRVDFADAGAAVEVTLRDNMEISGEAVIRASDNPMIVSDQVQAHILWMSPEPMIPGRQYIVKLCNRTATAWVSKLKYVINVETQEHVAAKTIELNDIAVCNLSFDRRMACDAYTDSRETGSFILIDRFTFATVGAGMIDFSLRRAQNLTVQSLTLDKKARAQSMGQKPFLLWFTGLSGAGKSTVANVVEQKLHEAGRRTYILDGDNVRHGLNRDLGFTDADRVENIRRIAEVAKLFVDAGFIVLVSAISPFRNERDMARGLLDDGEFLEIFVDASLDTCESRDPKGLYARARSGEIKNFTGIDSPYEAPEEPELVLDTDLMSPEAAADEVIALIEDRIISDDA